MVIRTQDKKSIIQCDYIRIYNTKITGDNNDLGNYDSEKRCLEILDDIQDCIDYNNHYSHSGVNTSMCQHYHYSVYVMLEK